MEPIIAGEDSQYSIVHGEPLDRNAKGLTIAAFAREITGRWPEREVVVASTPQGMLRWNYGELWDQAMAIARALAANGAGKGTRVGVLMSNRPEFLAAVFGIALAGGVIVALNTFATPSELEQLLKASEIDILLFESRVANKDFTAALQTLAPAIGNTAPGRLMAEKFPFLRLLVSLPGELAQPLAGVMPWQQFLLSGDTVPTSLIDARAATLSPADTAMLFFSSGSTGTPKGVLHSQRAVVLQWRGWAPAMGYTGILRAWTANGFFWSGNFAMVIGSALGCGGALVLQSAFEPKEALALIAGERVNAPFAMLHQWGRIAEEEGFNDMDLSHVNFLDPHYCGLHNPTIPTSFRQPQAFGCTETLTISTTTYFGDTGKTRREGHGLPLAGNTLKIVDPLTGRVVPRGQRGEIAVKGPTLMMGYLGKTPEECFDSEGFYHTGDGGYVDASGWLFWEGRLTDIIKTGGANVSPLEVDEVITTHPQIKATQTVGLPHDTLGEIVVACILPHDSSTFDVEEFRSFLKARLASYKLPREILILEEEELILTGSGNKIRAADMRELAAKRLAKQA